MEFVERNVFSRNNIYFVATNFIFVAMAFILRPRTIFRYFCFISWPRIIFPVNDFYFFFPRNKLSGHEFLFCGNEFYFVKTSFMSWSQIKNILKHVSCDRHLTNTFDVENKRKNLSLYCSTYIYNVTVLLALPMHYYYFLIKYGFKIPNQCFILSSIFLSSLNHAIATNIISILV